MTAEPKDASDLNFGAERYRFLVEQSGEMISTHRPGDWVYTAVNPAVKDCFGYTPEEVLGKPAYDFFYPEDAEAMKQKLIPAIHRHGVRTFRYRHRHKSGGYFWVESTHRSIRDEDSGELKEIITVTRDITAQVQAEMASRRLADVLQVSTDLVVFCDREFHVTYMNGSALEGFGLKESSEVNGFADLINRESTQRVKTLACQLARQKGHWRGNIVLNSPRFAGRRMELQEVLVHPQRSYTESDDYYTLMIRDVTDRLLAEREAQQHQAEIAHASRLMTMGEMASGIAHEINQPLATTLNYARGAMRQIELGKITAVEQLMPVLSNIARQADRAASIVKRLRALIKKTPYQRQIFEINPVCRDVVEFMKHDISAEGVEIEFELCDSEPAIDADRIQIEQVLVNLLRNAMDAYKEVQRENKIVRLTTQVRNAELQIRITDYGAGIDEPMTEKLFEPYVTSKEEGLGMGLSISRTIIETHGGVIEVDSDGVSYSCLSITLPAIDAQT
jgi:two-component system sensor kinase FixL